MDNFSQESNPDLSYLQPMNENKSVIREDYIKLNKNRKSDYLMSPLKQNDNDILD